MKKLLIVLVLLLTACAEIPPTGEYVVYPVGQTVTPQIVEGNGYKIFYGTTPTLQDAPTQEVTQLPTIAATSLPKPTEIPDTQTPTKTVTPTLVPTVSPSNTPVFTPIPATNTPTGTSTPVPSESACFGASQVATLRIRNTPSTSGTVVGTISQNSRVAIRSVQYQDISSTRTDEWVAISYGPLTGYAAAFYDNQVFIKYELTQECYNLRFPDPKTSFGVWIGTGANRDELLRFGNQFLERSIRPVATVYGDNDTAIALYNAGWVTALRPWYGDKCEFSYPVEVSARSTYGQARTITAGIPFTWLILTNECQFPSAEYARDWIAEVSARAKADNIKIVPVVFSTGTPSLEWWPVLYPALVSLQEAGGCLGLNLYPAVAGMGLSTDNSQTLWTVYRLQLYKHILPSKLPICVTEAARGLGEEIPNFTDISLFAQKVDGDYLWLTFWFDVMSGGMPPWSAANLNGKLDQLFLALKVSL